MRRPFIRCFVVVSGEADEQAQESVTLCYITRNAAEPHDWCRGAGGTVRSLWEEMHILGICFYPIGAVVIFIYDCSTSLSERLRGERNEFVAVAQCGL